MSLLLTCFLFLYSVSSSLSQVGPTFKSTYDDPPLLIVEAKENSIISIKEDFDLQGQTIKVPKNCTLSFEGGSISNGTVIFQNTRIVGNPRMEIVPQGRIAGVVSINWFGLRSEDPSFDNSVVFNKAGRVFSDLYVEPGDYYCKAPIDWSNGIIKNLTIDGNLWYDRQNTSDVFITLCVSRAIVKFNGSIYGPTKKIVESNTTEKSTGISFNDCNNSKIFLKSIGFFYKNILVNGSSAGIGNAYNDYEFIESFAARVLVHLSSEKKGWTASNVFKMLRLTSYGGYTVPDTALLIQGEGTESNAGFSDTVIEKLCIEGIKQSEPIKIIGANHFVIKNLRNEDNYPFLCYCQNVIEGQIFTNYGDVTIRPDNKSKVAVVSSDEMDTYEPLAKSYVIDSDGRHRLFNSVDAELESLVRYTPLNYTPIGMVTSSAVLGKPLRIQSGDPFILDVVYYDKNRKRIPIDPNLSRMPAGNVVFLKSNVIKEGFMSSSFVNDLKFVCPKLSNDVAYVGLFLRSRGSSPSPVFHISRIISKAVSKEIMSKQQYRSYLSYGPSNARPVFSSEDANYLIGYQYFDTTIGRVVFAKSISEKGVAVWVDSEGKQQ